MYNNELLDVIPIRRVPVIGVNFEMHALDTIIVALRAKINPPTGATHVEPVRNTSPVTVCFRAVCDATFDPSACDLFVCVIADFDDTRRVPSPGHELCVFHELAEAPPLNIAGDCIRSGRMNVSSCSNG